MLPLVSIHVLSEMPLGGTDYPKSYSKYSVAISSGVTGSQFASRRPTRADISHSFILRRPFASFKRKKNDCFAVYARIGQLLAIIVQR